MELTLGTARVPTVQSEELLLQMKYCRFQRSGEGHYGLIETVGGREMIMRALPDCSSVPPLDAEWEKIELLPLEYARLLAPVRPSKIICVGRNYKAHARELGNEPPTELMTFLKPPSSVIGPGAEIRRPAISQRVDHEGELGVVIGRECRKLREDEDARPYILGYTCVNDVTARDLQKTDPQWTRPKGFDTFCPVGPIVSSGLDPWKGIEVETRVSGDLRQHGTTADFIFPLDAIIRYISNVMTLLPGDLIATGTPEGVGPLKAGEVVEVTVAGVGTLRNPVVDD